MSPGKAAGGNERGQREERKRGGALQSSIIEILERKN